VLPAPLFHGSPAGTGPGAKAAKEAAQRIVRVAEQRGAMERYIRRGDARVWGKGDFLWCSTLPNLW